MRTNIDIDDTIMQNAMQAGGFKTKKEAVEAGLSLLAQRFKQREILNLFGKVDWEGDLNDMRTSKYAEANLAKAA
ncbi:MAG: type II toxin-antitoxin system VapB family antitoxin [Methylophilaceae bacterium]